MDATAVYTMSLPASDASLLRSLAKRFGWTAKRQHIEMAHTGNSAKVHEPTEKMAGKAWAHEVLLPTYLEVREATARGRKYPDVSELFEELEQEEA